MNQSPTLRERWQYALDNLFSRGPAAMILALAALSLVIILLAGAVIAIGSIAPKGEEPLAFGEAVWRSLMRTLDAGTMGGDAGWGFRWVQLFVTLGGIFIISALIGVLSSAIEARLESLRKGRSRVLESNHTVILGWSEQVFTIVSELAVANQSLRKASIAILGEKDKVEMEDELRQKVGPTGSTRLICRTGSPLESADLAITNLNAARSIIILSPPGENPDAGVIKVVLAITNHPGRRAQPYHIVAELRDPKNFDVAHMVGKDEVEFIQVSAYVARIIAQTCRQSGLSVVISELLNFGGDEIYFKEEPALAGQPISQAALAFEKCAVMGLAPAEGGVTLCPPPGTPLRPGDRLVLIAEDDSHIVLNPAGPAALVDESAIHATPPPAPAPEQTLLLGWNWRAPSIICELNNYVPPGSSVQVVTDLQDAQQQIAARCAGLRQLEVSFTPGDTTDRRLLDAVLAQDFDHVILLSYSDTLTAQQADAKTLMTLLHLRDIAEKTRRTFSIVSEMLDIRNRNLAEVTQADDFIVSDKLVSLILAQVSENKQINAVFTDLFDPEGAEIYLKPASLYVQLEKPVNFYSVVAAASRRGELALGYHLRAYAHQASKNYGLLLNPAKSQSITFTEQDRIIVLANQ